MGQLHGIHDSEDEERQRPEREGGENEAGLTFVDPAASGQGRCFIQLGTMGGIFLTKMNLSRSNKG